MVIASQLCTNIRSEQPIGLVFEFADVFGVIQQKQWMGDQ